MGNRTDSYSLPRINYKRSIATKIPLRVGLGTSLNLSSFDYENPDGSTLLEGSQLGMGNVSLDLEASILNRENYVLNIFFNQFLPSSSVAGPLFARDGYFDDYGFQTGLRYQISFLKYFTLFCDLAYAKYIDFDDGQDDTGSSDSLIYYNEIVLDTKHKVNLSAGLLGQTIFYDNFFGGNFNINYLYLVPGLIVPFGKYSNIQTRLGVPIGLTPESDDFGLQFSIFALI